MHAFHQAKIEIYLTVDLTNSQSFNLFRISNVGLSVIVVSPNNWEAVVVEQREKVQILLEGDLRRENRKENWIV